MFINNKQPNRIHKSSSTIVMKTSPSLNTSKIVFNPNQFEVGQSKIQKLPQRVITRRNSQPTLPRTQKYSVTKQTKQLENSLLIQINQKLSKQNKELSKQNKQLKKEIQLLKRATRSNTISKRNSYLEESSRHEKGQLKKLTIDKISCTKSSSKLVSQGQTGLYSSKQISYGQFQCINQIYNNLIQKSIKPTLIQFQQQLKKFYTDIQQSFKKIKFIFSNLQAKQIKSFSTSHIQCQCIISTLSTIFQTKNQSSQQSKKSPPNYLIQKSRSKVKVQRQLFSKQKANQDKQDPLEVLSEQQIIQKFQKYILKILRNQKMIKLLKSNLVVRKFTKKLAQA